jgi:hypothetical protein
MNASVTTTSRVRANSLSGLFGVHRRAIGATIIVSALLLVGLAGSWRAPGVTIDEGIVLEYPELILHGEVPFRDFQSSYGPGAYLPLAAAYQVLGPSVTVERAVGVAYRLALVLAIFALLWPLGAALALAGGSLAALAILPIGSPAAPVAYGWYFALACVLWGLWCARAAMTGRPKIAAALWAGSGLLVGLAASARPDLGVAALVSSAILVLSAGAIARLGFTIGLAVGVSPLVWNLLAAGWSQFWSYGVAARLHQLPESGYPFPMGAGFLLALDAATLLVVFTAIRERRRLGANPMTRCGLALAVLCVLILPQVFQRSDGGHFAFVAPLSFGLLPWAAFRSIRSPLTRAAIPLMCAVVIGFSAAASYSNKGVLIHNDGRTFAATAATNPPHLHTVLRWLDTHVAPGRKLFAGPADLRWAFYAPTELYFLTPGLQPAGFYLELGPGDDTPLFTTRLIDDLKRADVLVLERLQVSYWRRHIWPQARVGSSAPNAVVRRDFRAVLETGPYSIWARIRRGHQPAAPAVPTA